MFTLNITSAVMVTFLLNSLAHRHGYSFLCNCNGRNQSRLCFNGSYYECKQFSILHSSRKICNIRAEGEVLDPLVSYFQI